MTNAVTFIKKYKKEVMIIFLIAITFIVLNTISYNINILNIIQNIRKFRIISIFLLIVSIIIILLRKKYNDKIINKKNIILFIIPIFIFMTLFYAYYPGIITYDGNFQWQQVQTGIIEPGHPFLTTLFMLILSKIYNSTSLIIFFQIIIFSLIWSYFCNKIGNTKKDFIIQLVYTILLCIIPIISIYSITLWKDILYSYYLMGLSVLIYVGIKNNFNYNTFEYLLLLLLLFMIFNYRYNGIIVVILFIIIFLVYKIKEKKVIKKFICTILILIISIFLFNIYKNYYMNHNSNNQESVKVGLSTIDSYIFWMYGAHLNDENIKSKEDKDFLSNIADINEWKNKYNPYLINNSNTIYKDLEYIINNNKKYKKLFIETSIKNPQTIIMHYLKSDALLLSPINQGYVYIYDFSKWNVPYGFDGKIKSRLPIIEKKYTNIINLTYMEPINIIFHRPANVMYISIILSIIIAIREKNRKIILILLPMILNTISLLPINLAQDLRYVYINYLTLAIIMLLFIKCLFNIKRSKK